jgi:hypothetical protein
MQWIPSEKKEQPEQEPVCVAFIRTYVGKDKDGIEICKEEPLYTTPQKRTWVGLTDAEIAELHHEIKVRLMGTYKAEDIYRAIEAKLREKNT